MFINKIIKEIAEKEIKAVLTKSVLIPTLSNRPITLNGIPNLTKGIEIFSEALGFSLPSMKPKIKKGKKFIKSNLIVLN